MHSILLLYS